MDGTGIHPLRLPRVITGLVGRARNVERVAVWDEVPVAIPTREAKDAPIVFDDRMRDRAHRVHEGRLYARLGEGRGGPSRAWEAALARNEKWIVGKVGEPPPRRQDANASAYPVFGRFYPWTEGFGGASRRRGVAPVEAVRFRQVIDDGVAARDAAAQALSGRLLALGPELWARVSLPRYRIRLEESVGWRFESTLLDWHDDPEWGLPWDMGSFRLDRARDALAYAKGISTEDRPFHLDVYRDEVRIVEPGLLADCYDRLADEDTLAMLGISHGIGEALRPHLGALPVPEVARWVALQGLRAAADLDGMRAWMDGAAGTREALAGAGIPRSQTYGPPDAVDLLDAAILRYESLERPRMNLGRDGDEAALTAL